MRRLKGEDNSFLAWESAVQPQHTVKAVVLDPTKVKEPFDFDRFKDVVQAWAARVEPLQWQLLAPRAGVGRPWWVSRPRLDMEYHVQRTTAPAPGGDEQLAATIGELFESPLDRDRPAWQIWYVEGLADGKIALVLKIHHAVADGGASVRLLETIYGNDPNAPLPAPCEAPEDEQRPGAATWFPQVGRVQLTSWGKFPSIIGRTAHVTSVIRARRKAGKPGYAEAFTAPAMKFNEPLSPGRSFAYRRVDMAEVKRVAKAYGVTVNDVFLSICAGALREYLQTQGDLDHETPLTAVVPVSMRPSGEEVEWGNHVARWNVELATQIADPVERLTAIATSTRNAREVQAERDDSLQHDWMEYWPLFWVYSRVLPIAGARATKRPMFSLIASNMRGPKQLYLGGAPIEQLISTGPLVFPMGLNFTGWSYEKDMTICVLACSDHIPQTFDIADHLPAMLAELAARAPAADGEEPAKPAPKKTAARKTKQVSS
jgi:WS/DGAT/MGAT family acyltransferase